MSDNNIIPILKHKKMPDWDGRCHGCSHYIHHQPKVAQIGPFWICDLCIENYFPNEKYSVNQAADILEKIRGFK